MHVIAGKAVALGEALTDDFKNYQKQIVKNAAAMADEFSKIDVDMVSGGTDNHLILLDLRKLGVTGKEAEHNLDEVSITVNKNAIPNDPQSPFITSGIRIGTPAVTTRGMKEDDMRLIARLIKMTLTDFEGTKDEVRNSVKELVSRYKLYE